MKVLPYQSGRNILPRICRLLLGCALLSLCSCVSNLSGQITAPAKHRMVLAGDFCEPAESYQLRQDEDGYLYAQLPMVSERGSGTGWIIDINENSYTWEREGKAQTRWVRFHKDNKLSAEVLPEEPQVPLKDAVLPEELPVLRDAGMIKIPSKIPAYSIRTEPTTDSSAWWRYPLAGLTCAAADAPLTIVYTAGAVAAMPFYLITAAITGYRG